ncbi:MAG TPA: sensor domain-containing protein [Streptosporangiaceae bacterium]
MSTTADGLVRAAVRAPFTERAGREVLYAAAGLVPAAVGFWLAVTLLVGGTLLTVSLVGTFIGLLVLVLTLRLSRGLGSLHRRIASRVLHAEFAAPPAFRPGRGVLRRVDARLRDGTGWRSLAYLVLKLPVALLQAYAVSYWAIGVIDMAYPMWWLFFHHGSQGPTAMSAISPLPIGKFAVTGWPDTLVAYLLGGLILLAAPWVMRAVTAGDRWLVRNLLGPAQLAQRVAELERRRADAVDDAAAALRRVERDLHDGAQVRLAALAMGLGMAKEKLGLDGDPGEIERIRELVDSAHRNAKEALVELRDLARGIHPPVLDAGLADALTTLAARSLVPVELTTDIRERPTPAIETIAYLCAAELLANVAKHSGANKVTMDAVQRGNVLRLRVSDDGVGGVDPTRGSGLPGLVQRVRTVDGHLGLTSPEGGPTVVTIELPLRA